MKAVIQRASWARVTVDKKIVAEIGSGLVALIGVQNGDTEANADALAKKTAYLRIFNDDQDKMNLSVLDTGGGVIAVSQFTLCADTSHGRRPSYMNAAAPEIAEPLYLHYVKKLREYGATDVQTGIFGAHMEVGLLNDGPVTLLLEA